MDQYVKEAADEIEKAIDSFQTRLAKIQTGRANPSILNGIQCDYYGDKMDITSLASVSMPEPRQLLVKPYSREDLKAIATAIAAANIGINPQTEADQIRLVFPPMTTEVRKESAKKAKAMGDEAKVAIRQARRDAMDLLKADDTYTEDLQKRVEEDIQKEVDKGNKRVDEIVENKTKELMTI